VCRYVRELGLKDVEHVVLDYHDKKEHKEPEFLKVTKIPDPMHTMWLSSA
jgi:hypothetical protein